MKMVKKKCEGAVKKGNALGEFYFFHIIYQFSLYVLNFIAQFGGRVAARFGEIAGRGGQGRAPRGRLPAVPPFNVNRNQAAAGGNEIIEGGGIDLANLGGAGGVNNYEDVQEIANRYQVQAGVLHAMNFEG